MNWGLKGRSIALCLVLLLGTVAALSTALIWLNYRDSMRTMRRHAIVHAHAIAQSAEPSVLLNDPAALEPVVAAALEDEAVCGVKIFDAKGSTLTSRGKEGHSKEAELRQHPQPLIPEGLLRGGQSVYQTASRLLVIAPIWSETREIDLEILDDETDRPASADSAIGHVALLYTLNGIRAEFVERVLSVMVVALLVITIGVTTTMIAVRQLLDPLKNLVATTDAIARGDRSKRATEQAVGEIGELARSFNSMADRVQDSYATIERKVTERTAELRAREGELENEVTERRQAQEELSEHARLLKAQNLELEAHQQQLKAQQLELLATNQAMEEARLAAEASSRAKSDFLANMSHEIRTPMTAIIGFAETLLDPELSDSDRLNAINTVRRNGEHLLSIINDILDISKIEAGRLELEKLSCSPIAVVGEVESLMRARAEGKSLSFDVEYLTEVPETVRTDPTRLRQILINLMGNAIKFTQSGGVRLNVRLLEANREAQASPPMLRFDVIDTGIGMAPEQIPRAFKSFTQADETMSRRFGGTGLGLTISSHLAAMLGGEITVESEPNKGSTFSVTIATGSIEGIPLLDPQACLALDQPKEEPNAPQASRTEKLNCRVLLVEDGPDNQRLVSFVLRKAGAEVVVAENGRVGADEAMAAWKQQQPFDVILMDMQMPVLDGYGATSLLRRKGYRGPIIALTAHAMSTDREKCLTAGCDEYLTKPVNRKNLVQLVARFAQEGNGRSSDAPTSTRRGYET